MGAPLVHPMKFKVLQYDMLTSKARSSRQNTSFRVIKAEGDSKESFLSDYPESICCYKQRLQAGHRIFGLIISKSTQRSGACGGQISPGSTRRLEGLAKDSGPIISQGHLFVGQGRNHWQNGSTQDWINSSPDGSMDLNVIHNIDLIFPRSTLKRRN